ncbi:DNA-binding response OmpR family regulator [Paenibacillus rhizosphaerae]|uniref:DNA-binding response OmpR family regulator n=1 Tax=Paenibacillus rhizosphaerae TaxID=297318 RepID=A0A839TMN2_9BACL|nr:response regulator transcription factor [Paenibacillus rhizosphaerae]MBB3126047.1 DNA-binding response OmpR family regulator [Paenibacillus rhizosphaerae]
MPKRILLVEDDREISQLIESHLKQENYEVFIALDGEEAESFIDKEVFDLVLLDLMLPKINGMDVLKRIREKSVVPVMIISARGSDLDKALGLGFGADDYLSKPFSMIELTARVQAAIRRATQYVRTDHQPTEDRIHYKDLTLDINAFSVLVRGQSVPLTSKEFHILKLFLTYQSRVFTKEQIYQSVWQEDYYGNENVINVHIRRLREKIEEDPSNPQFICTIWGIGYKLGG